MSQPTDLETRCQVLEELLARARAQIDARVHNEGNLLQEIETLKGELAQFALAKDYVEVLVQDSWQAERQRVALGNAREWRQMKEAQAWITELLDADGAMLVTAHKRPYEELQRQRAALGAVQAELERVRSEGWRLRRQHTERERAHRAAQLKLAEELAQSQLAMHYVEVLVLDTRTADPGPCLPSPPGAEKALQSALLWISELLCSEASPARAEGEVEQLRGRMRTAERQLAQVRDERKGLAEEAKSKDRANLELQTACKGLESRLANAEAELAAKGEERRKLRQELQRLSGLHTSTSAWDSVSSDVVATHQKGLDTRVVQLQAALEAQSEERKKLQSELERRIGLERKLMESQADLEAYGEEKALLHAELSKREALAQQLVEAQAALAAYAEERAHLHEELARREGLEEDLSRVQASLLVKEQERRILYEELERRKGLEGRIARTQAELETKDEERGRLYQELQRRRGVEDKLAQEQQEVRRLQEELGRYKGLEKTHDEARAALEAYAEEKSRLLEELGRREGLERRVTDLQSMMLVREQEQRVLQQEMDRRQGLESLLATARAQLDLNEQERRKLQDELARRKGPTVRGGGRPGSEGSAGESQRLHEAFMLERQQVLERQLATAHAELQVKDEQASRLQAEVEQKRGLEKQLAKLQAEAQARGDLEKRLRAEGEHSRDLEHQLAKARLGVQAKTEGETRLLAEIERVTGLERATRGALGELQARTEAELRDLREAKAGLEKQVARAFVDLEAKADEELHLLSQLEQLKGAEKEWARMVEDLRAKLTDTERRVQAEVERWRGVQAQLERSQAEARAAVAAEQRWRSQAEQKAVPERQAQAELQWHAEHERQLKEEVDRQKVVIFVLETELAAVTSERDRLRSEEDSKGTGYTKEETTQASALNTSVESRISTSSAASDLGSAPPEDRAKARRLLSGRRPSAEQCGCYLVEALVMEYSRHLRQALKEQPQWKDTLQNLTHVVEAVSGKPRVYWYGVWPKSWPDVQDALKKQEELNVRACAKLMSVQAQLEVLVHNMQLQWSVSQTIAHEKTSLEEACAAKAAEAQDLTERLDRAMGVIARLQQDVDRLQTHARESVPQRR